MQSFPTGFVTGLIGDVDRGHFVVGRVALGMKCADSRCPKHERRDKIKAPAISLAPLVPLIAS